MSLVEFRNMENKAQNKSNPKAKQDLKLSFRKLAAARGKFAASGQPTVTPHNQPSTTIAVKVCTTKPAFI